jgi:hypothetical protein
MKRAWFGLPVMMTLSLVFAALSHGQSSTEERQRRILEPRALDTVSPTQKRQRRRIREPRPSRTITPEIVFFEAPKISARKIPALRSIRPRGTTIKPKSLSTESRAAVIKKLHSLTGKFKERSGSNPSPQITLTPDKPRSGMYWIKLFRGEFNPRGTMYYINQSVTYGDPYIKLQANLHSRVYLHFEPTIPGKTYLVDLSVSNVVNGPNSSWLVAISNPNGPPIDEHRVTPQGGHLLFAFLASDSSIEYIVRLDPHTESNAALFSCQLTRVD